MKKILKFFYPAYGRYMYEKLMLHIEMGIFFIDQRGSDAEPSEFTRKNIFFYSFYMKVAMFEDLRNVIPNLF